MVSEDNNAAVAPSAPGMPHATDIESRWGLSFVTQDHNLPT